MVADSSTTELDQVNSSAELPPLEELTGRNYVTLRQFCTLVGRTYQTGLRWVKPDKDGKVKVKAVHVGGGWRIYEEELRRFLDHGNREG